MLHTVDGTIYFAGTSSGLFSTTVLAGINTIWVRESENQIGNIKIDMVKARSSDGFVVVATQGNGIYGAYVKSITNKIDYSIDNKMRIMNYPNPCYDNTSFYIELSEDGIYTLELFNLSGMKIITVFEKFYVAGKYKINYQLDELNSGTYIYTLNNRKYKISGKMNVF